MKGVLIAVAIAMLIAVGVYKHDQPQSECRGVKPRVCK